VGDDPVRADPPQDAVVRVRDDHLAVDSEGEVVRVAEQRRACGTAVAGVALLARAGERVHGPVRRDEADPVVVLGDHDRLVVVELEAADPAEGRGRRRAAVARVAQSAVAGDRDLPRAGDPIDPISGSDVQPQHVVERERDDVAQARDHDAPPARSEIDPRDAVELPPGGASILGVKVPAVQYGDRKVYSVAAFNRGVAEWLGRLPTVWVEGEVTELRRHPNWQSVFFTLKDPSDGACLSVTMPRGQFDGLRLDLADGERVHVYGRPTLFETKGDLRLRALTIERFGLGDHLAALERLKRKLSAEGLFAAERKRALPRFPRRIGLLTGNDAAAKRDVLTTITTRFPAARVVVAETYVQGPRAAPAIVAALEELCGQRDVDVVVLARGGGSFDDLLPFSDERLVRAVAGCSIPVVSAVGHEQDSPLCDLAADVRASTPTAAGRLVVPNATELVERLGRTRGALDRGIRRTLERAQERLDVLGDRLGRAPALTVERKRAALEHAAGRLRALSPRATLVRGYAIVRAGDGIVRSPGQVEAGARIDVEVAEGEFGARVE
jgi:exodeoxyribonuclease VII large subunit